MKKLLLLFCALLCLGGSRAWATDGSVTITSSSAAWSENGTFSNTSGTSAGSWRSTNGIISVLCLDGQANILDYATKSRLTNGKSFLIVANGDNHITGFSIKFKTYNEDGTNRNGYITFHDGVNVDSKSSAEVTKSFSGLNAQVIKFTTGNNWVDIIDFSVSYAEGSDNTLRSTTPINTFNSEAYAAWLKVQTPSDYIFYTMSSLRMNLRTSNYNYDVYLVVSDHLVGSGTTSGLSESDFTAISSNSSGTSSTDVTFNFTNPVTLRGGSIYYLYFATKSDDTYTLSQRGIKVQTGSNSLGVGANATDTGIYGSSNTWSIPFTATLTPVTSNLKCRLKAKWPNTSTSAQHYTNYVFAKTDNLNKLFKNNKTELSAADMINAKMVWNVTYSGSGLKLQNVGTERYISKFTSYKANGDAINLLTAENSTNAETLKIQEYNTQGQGYIALVSGNQLSVNNSISFLESFSSTNDYVGCHNNYDAGDAFIFERVKTVTFVDGEGEAFNVAVNDGDAVSAIYVACDGSSASTLSLPSDNFYSLDGGETLLSNTDAAEAISAAGTSNISVIVAPAVSVTYNLIWDDPSTPIKTKASVNAPKGFSPSVTVPWDAPAFCDFSYDVSTIEESTTEVNVTMDWDGPFEFSSNFASAKWYYMTLRNKYVQNDGKDPYLLTTSKDEVLATKGHWAFMGNPYAVKVINELAGDGKYLDDVGTNPQMGTTGTEWIITESSTSGAFQLHVDANKYISDNGGYGKFTYWNSTSAINEAGGLLRVEEVPDDMMDQVTANIMPYVNYPGNGYFQLTSDEASMFSSAIETYNADGGISDIEYKTLLTYLNGYLSYPNSGYYIITNDNSSMYMGFPNDGADYTHLKKYENLGFNTIAKLEKQTDNTYFVSFQGKYLYCYGHNQYIDGFSSYKTTVSGIVEGNSVVLKSNGCYVCVDNNGLYGKNTTDVSAKWTVADAAGTEFDISLTPVNGKSYATFSAPFPVTIGDGAKAYTVELTDENTKATYKEIPSKQIPAGAGILLISATAETSVTATVSATDFDALEDNDLVGYFLSQKFTYPTETSTWNLVLGVSSGTVGFYKMNTEIAASANKAYLPYPHDGSSSVKGLVLVAGDETGIKALDNGQRTIGDAEIFNLAGQRMSRVQKGVNIVNGQKVLVK